MPPRKRKPQPWGGLYNSKPSMAVCSECRTKVLRAHIEGFLELLDLAPLSPLGEVAALLQGSRTFLWCDNGRVYRRTTWNIKTAPIPVTGLVVRIHQCGNGAALVGPFQASFETKAEESDECPF